MFRSTVSLIVVALLGTMSLQALADDHAGHAKPDLVEAAAAAGSFETLIAAARAAELVETLKGDGPYTLFAPTDAAFARLPEGTVENLLKEENREQLRSILLYHVVSGRVPASEVAGKRELETAQGSPLSVKVEDGEVHIGNARVIQADIEARNGVIHVIDAVVLPGDSE